MARLTNGGIIGKFNAPANVSANGKWNTQDQQLYNAQNLWGGNFFGDGSDGALVVASNTSLDVLNANGLYDADMVVRQYTSLTIQSGATLTTSQPCRGLLIYVSGDCTISGSLSMTARGANANPTLAGASDQNAVSESGLRFPFITSGGSQTITTSSLLLNGCGNIARSAISRHPSLVANGTVLTIPRIGADGAPAVSCATGYAANSASDGVGGQTGGGGGGGRSTGGMYAGVERGGIGSCFSGGSGSGGSAHAGSSNCASPGGQGGDYGGPGGYSTAYTGTASGNGHTAGGGAGNPGGTALIGNATPVGNPGSNGTGGLLILVVGGNLIINNGGIIQADGTNGGDKSGGNDGSGGGGSGGGSIALVYRGTYTNNGTVRANGGNGGSGNASGTRGGHGSIQTLKVI